MERWRYSGPTGPQLPDVQSLQSPKFPTSPLGARNLALSKFAKRKNEKSKNRPKPVGMPGPALAGAADVAASRPEARNVCGSGPEPQAGRRSARLLTSA